MARYIDADKLQYSRVQIVHSDGTIGGYHAVVMSAEIKDAPTADVVEVKHGEWVHSIRGFDVSGDYECSVCQSPSGIKHFYNGKKYSFCPDCGAKMDGERREANEN